MRNMMAARRHFIGFLLLILMVAGAATLFLYDVLNSHSSAQVRNGCLDLHGWDKDQVVSLNGDWEFYPFHFSSMDEINTKSFSKTLIAVPSVWNGCETDGKKMPGFGYATYRLHVTGLKAGEPISMRISPMSTAYEFFIDGRKMAQCGTVGTSSGQHIPHYDVQMFQYTPQASQIDLIVYVSNFTYDRGGMWFTPVLGTPSAINSMTKSIEYRDWFLLGAIFIIGLSAIEVVVLRRKMKEVPYFLLLCFFVVARITITSSYIMNLIPFCSNLEVNVRLEYFTLILGPASFLLLSRSQFPKLFQGWFQKVALLYSALAALFTLVTPIHIFVLLKPVTEIYILLVCSYILYKLFFAYFDNQRNVFPILAGTILFIDSLFYDFLLQNCYISFSSIEVGPVGFLFFLISEAYVIAKQYAAAQKDKEIALERVLELQQDARAAELKFLKSQIRPHFINNALNAIVSISRTDIDQSRKLLVEFSKYLRSCYDFDNLEDTVPIENELSFVQSYIALEQARFRDKLRVEYRIDDVSIPIPPLVLQPLVENAIIHGIRNKPGGGNILIYIIDCGDTVKIGVKDDGVGIAPERIEDLLNGSSGARGVGILNINQRLNKLYGISLHIESAEDGGADIYMLIPKKQGVM